MQLFLSAFLSGIFSGAVAIAATRAIERFGGTIGGIIGSMPTTIVPASIGIASHLSSSSSSSSAESSGGVSVLEHAMFSVPLGMGMNSLFLLVWRHLPPLLPHDWSLTSKLIAMVLSSLSFWLVCAVVVVTAEGHVNDLSRLGLAAFMCHILVGVVSSWTPPPSAKSSNHVPMSVILLRGTMAFLAVFIAVLLSSRSGIVSGIASTFPAIFTTTMVSLWISQGAAVSAGAVGPMMIGSSSVSAYAMTFAALFPILGYGACIVSWLTAVCVCSIPSTFYLRWRRTECAAPAQSPVALSPPPSVVPDQEHQEVTTTTATCSPLDQIQNIQAEYR